MTRMHQRVKNTSWIVVDSNVPFVNMRPAFCLDECYGIRDQHKTLHYNHNNRDNTYTDSLGFV